MPIGKTFQKGSILPAQNERLSSEAKAIRQEIEDGFELREDDDSYFLKSGILTEEEFNRFGRPSSPLVVVTPLAKELRSIFLRLIRTNPKTTTLAYVAPFLDSWRRVMKVILEATPSHKANREDLLETAISTFLVLSNKSLGEVSGGLESGDDDPSSTYKH